MHPNEEMLTNFYSALGEGWAETMAASYTDDATFSDPVFPELDAAGVRDMWRMFCTSDTELELTVSDVQADHNTGSATWRPVYTFPKTGRQVRNVIESTFTFRDGLIVRHRDDFDFYRWARMALGPMGTALGWTPLVRNQVRQQAARQLRRFREA